MNFYCFLLCALIVFLTFFYNSKTSPTGWKKALQYIQCGFAFLFGFCTGGMFLSQMGNALVGTTQLWTRKNNQSSSSSWKENMNEICDSNVLCWLCPFSALGDVLEITIITPQETILPTNSN